MKIDVIKNFIEEGGSIRSAAVKFSIPVTTLSRALKDAGIVSIFQQKIQNSTIKKDEAREMRKHGMSFESIARSVNFSPTAIKSWCEDIILTEDQEKCIKGISVDKQKQAIQLRIDGLYITEIAKKLNCSKSSVSLWLKQARKLPNNHNLDTRVIQRKPPAIVREVKSRNKKNNLTFGEIKEEIIFWKSVGYTFKEIAVKLQLTPSAIDHISRKHLMNKSDIEDGNKIKNMRTKIRRQNGELKPCGGERKGAGHSKCGYYKGIYCGSTYELCWVIYQLEHGIKFSRFSGFLENKEIRLKYYPDFLLADGKTIVELKGYEKSESVNKKSKMAENQGYIVKVLRKKDLKEIFDYVDQKYNVYEGVRQKLFDDYKPKFSLECVECKKTFFREKMNVSKLQFCSSSCSAKNKSKKTNTKNK